jgi:hypothetical protein
MIKTKKSTKKTNLRRCSIRMMVRVKTMRERMIMRRRIIKNLLNSRMTSTISMRTRCSMWLKSAL